MKIGFVLDDGLDRPDGVQQYILTLGEWLTSQGHEVRYLVGETKRPDIEGVYSMAKNIKVRFNGNSLSIPAVSSKKRIKEVLGKEQFDILHVQTPYSPFMGARVVKYTDASMSIIGTFHILPYGWISSVGTYLLGFYLRLNLRNFDKFISVSEPAAKFAKKTFGINSIVIPNLVNTDNFKPLKTHKTNNQITMLFLGRLVQRKGCKSLIAALSILKANKTLPSSLRLDICGDGPMRNELQEMVDQNGLEKNVVFHGFVSEEKKIAFMQNADMSVFPSLAGESFGIVLIEAMAAGGGIVLGGDNPGYRMVLEDAPGSIVDSRHSDKFAEQLIELIKDLSKRQALYDKQQKLVK